MIISGKIGYILVITFICCMFCKPILGSLIIGPLVLYYSINSWRFLSNVKHNGIECEGIILSYEPDDEGHKTPIIEFETFENKIIKEKPYYYASTDLSIFLKYQNNLNKKVLIIYDKENPEKFVLKTETNFNYGSLIFAIIISLIFITIGFANLLGYIKI